MHVTKQSLRILKGESEVLGSVLEENSRITQRQTVGKLKASSLPAASTFLETITYLGM